MFKPFILSERIPSQKKEATDLQHNYKFKAARVALLLTQAGCSMGQRSTDPNQPQYGRQVCCVVAAVTIASFLGLMLMPNGDKPSKLLAWGFGSTIFLVGGAISIMGDPITVPGVCLAVVVGGVGAAVGLKIIKAW